MCVSSLSSSSENSSLKTEKCLNEEVYAELRRLAYQQMSQGMNGATLQATVLVHEAWLRLSKREADWEDRGHFLAGAVTTMRHILIDHARRRARQRHGGDCARASTVTVSEFAAPGVDERILLIDEAVQALEKVDPEGAQVVVARFFGGLKTPEIAEALGISARSVDRHWASAKVWLFRWIRSANRA